MKNFKRAFTLAEILIVLAVVGVIAALVLPALVQDYANAKTMSNVSRTYELVQNGMKNILSTAMSNNENGDEITLLAAVQRKDIFGGNEEDFVLFGDSNYGLFSQTTALTGMQPANVSDDYITDIITYDGNKLADIYADLTNFNIYKFAKLSSFAAFNPPTGDHALQEESHALELAETPIGALFIDANGEDAPNQVGVDIFLFTILNNGHIIPVGTDACADLPITSTGDAAVCTQNNAGDGRGCSARVMANGWKIDY